jgi:N-acetyl-gamma-glutamyl-phosphate reductase
MIKVGIIGASGYTGAESIRILLQHPQAKLTILTALPEECGAVEDIFPQFKGRCDMKVEPLDLDKVAQSSDVVLCCLPHKVSMGFVPKLLDAGLKVIDFSADYRIRDIAVYEKFYVKHTDPENLKKAAFGLPELFRKQIKGARLVANPGCYPTGASLAVAPLLKKNLIEDSVIVNSVTGSSGAGNKPTAKFHFPNMNENLFPYGIGTHRHTPEIEQIMTDVAGRKIEVLFQPHAGPFDRGILSTVYCQPKGKLDNEELLKLYNDFYKGEQFVRVCKIAPGVKDIVGGNYCHIYPCSVKGKVVVFSAIDNLTKGAAGQAVQNMNIIFGIDETLGLL